MIQQQQAIGFLKDAVEGSEGGTGGADIALQKRLEGFPDEAEQSGIRVNYEDARAGGGRGRRSGQVRRRRRARLGTAFD